jgi:predicted Zn-dependent protease
VAALAVLAAGLAGVAGAHLWAWHHYRAARAALEGHRVPEAQRHLQQCLRVWPTSGSAHLLAARADRLAGDFDGAERHRQRAEELRAEHDATVLEWALLRAQIGDVDEVEKFLRERVDRGDPDSPAILEALTEGYLRMYRVVQAMACLERWLRLRPDDPQALFCRGRAWQRVHAYPKAADDFRRVVDLEPGHDEARLLLANALLESGRFEEGTAELEFLHQRQPDNPEVLVRLAFGRNNLGHPEEAGALLDALLAEHPGYGPALTAQGQLALQAGRHAEAERWLRQALAVTPYDRQAHFLLCQCLQQSGQEAEARAEQARLKHIETSIERLFDLSNRQMSQHPHDPALHYEIGTLLIGLGQEELGVRWFHSALKEDPHYAPAQAALARYAGRTTAGKSAPAPLSTGLP